MALANYSDLLAAVASWLNRSDLTAVIPDMIALAEAEFNRTLRTMEMEGRATATTGSAVAVPSDFIGLRSVFINDAPLAYVSASDFFSLDVDSSGTPAYYTIADGQFFFKPTPSSSTVEITYYQKIPALTASNTTNWLMTKHPDLYLFATLAQGEFYTWDDDRLPLVKARVEEIMAQIEADETRRTFGSAALAPRLQAPAYLA